MRAQLLQRTRFWMLLLCCLMLSLSSCIFTEVLFSKLSEEEANRVVAVLFKNDIKATKINKGKGFYAVEVAAGHFAHSVQITSQWGFPWQTTENLGDLFKPSGLVSTPMEEQVRYIHGLAEELKSTIRQIEGVNHVNVHIAFPSIQNSNASVLAQNTPDLERSKASVLVKYSPGQVQPSLLLSRITRLVSDSVPRLDDDRIVVLAEEDQPYSKSARLNRPDVYVIGNVQIRYEDFPLLASGLGTLVLVCILLAGIYAFISIRPSK